MPIIEGTIQCSNSISSPPPPVFSNPAVVVRLLHLPCIASMSDVKQALNCVIFSMRCFPESMHGHIFSTVSPVGPDTIPHIHRLELLHELHPNSVYRSHLCPCRSCSHSPCIDLLPKWAVVKFGGELGTSDSVV